MELTDGVGECVLVDGLRKIVAEAEVLERFGSDGVDLGFSPRDSEADSLWTARVENNERIVWRMLSQPPGWPSVPFALRPEPPK